MTDRRLIEEWLPIAALGEESVRERRSMTALPPIYYLHVWWARRPLVASRAAVLASVLPADADRGKFMHALGIHGDPVAAKHRIAAADRRGERLGADAYGYSRAFSWTLDDEDRAWLAANGVSSSIKVLDPTAGGGSIPFETIRLGMEVLANDLNPVAALIEKATIEYPLKHGMELRDEFLRLGAKFVKEVRLRLEGFHPDEPVPGTRPDGYLWSRTITCPYCDGLVPLSPNWRLAPDGTGVRLRPELAGGPGSKGRRCAFEIVRSLAQQSAGTVGRGDVSCPFPDCGRVVDDGAVREMARAGAVGEQLYAVVFKRRIETRTKSGKRGKDKWERSYRAPRPEDDNSEVIRVKLSDKMPEWKALGLIPNEAVESAHPKYDPRRWGIMHWTQFFSPRQLLGHVTAVEIISEMLAEETAKEASPAALAAFIYLALSLDKLRDYNSVMTRWHVNREVMVNTFDRHDFSFKWSYAEMAPLITGLGYDWAIEQTAKCIEELVELVRPDADPLARLLDDTPAPAPPPVTITCKPGDALDHVADGSIDVVVIDPPYYDNVMYAELSDFFYVWLKRTAGRVVPELFTRRLTDKGAEAVANPARFAGQKGAKELAGRDYQEKMARIFAECRRVLKPSGIMTLMFTHKATGARDALTTGLMQAGFAVTASWPINTEAEGSLHIKDKAGQQHHLPRLPPARGRRCLRWQRLLGGRRAPGPGCRQEARQGVPGGRDRRRGPLSRLLRPRARGVQPPLALEARHAAAEARGSQAPPAVGAVRGGLGSLRRHARGRARRRPARGQALASRAAHPHEGEREPGPADELVRARLGRLQGTGLPL